jgi:hypothetical protein
MPWPEDVPIPNTLTSGPREFGRDHLGNTRPSALTELKHRESTFLDDARVRPPDAPPRVTVRGAFNRGIGSGDTDWTPVDGAEPVHRAVTSNGAFDLIQILAKDKSTNGNERSGIK